MLEVSLLLFNYFTMPGNLSNLHRKRGYYNDGQQVGVVNEVGSKEIGRSWEGSKLKTRR